VNRAIRTDRFRSDILGRSVLTGGCVSKHCVNTFLPFKSVVSIEVAAV